MPVNSEGELVSIHGYCSDPVSDYVKRKMYELLDTLTAKVTSEGLPVEIRPTFLEGSAPLVLSYERKQWNYLTIVCMHNLERAPDPVDSVRVTRFIAETEADFNLSIFAMMSELMDTEGHPEYAGKSFRFKIESRTNALVRDGKGHFSEVVSMHYYRVQ